MWRFLKARGVDLAIVVVALTALMAQPVWSGPPPPPMPGPAAGGLLAGAAVVVALVIAKLWRRK